MKIFFSVGEPSGDLHGANLIRHLQEKNPNVECVGLGGPKMEAAGCELHADLTAFAVMWFARVLMHLPTFWRLLSQADRYFQHHRPDAVVLIDYPGFNWWIARRAKAHGIPVFYYGVPQLWAWAGWRIKKMRRFVDHVLCKLPFEEKWYRDRGCEANYVGHPYFDELRTRPLDKALIERLRAPAFKRSENDTRNCESPLVTILPGSRTQEVASNLKWFLKTAERVRGRVPTARFAIASFKPSQADMAKEALAQANVDAEIFVGKTAELIEAATCCMAVSGSVSLELLYHAKPSVILYWVSRQAFFAQKYFRKVKYITLANLLAAKEPCPGYAANYDPNDPADAEIPMPEYLTCEDKTEQLAEHLVEWLTDSNSRLHRVQQLKELGKRVSQGGASCRAAEYILKELESVSSTPLKPHAIHFAA